jgi:hypothetical protein
MNDIEISRAMKRLPRTSASPHFASDVLRRLESPAEPQPARTVWRLASAFAMILCLAVLGFEGKVLHDRQQRLVALRAEHQQLESELQQVKAIADDPRPVVVLENADTRVIVPVAMAGRRNTQTAQRPIMY